MLVSLLGTEAQAQSLPEYPVSKEVSESPNFIGHWRGLFAFNGIDAKWCLGTTAVVSAYSIHDDSTKVPEAELPLLFDEIADRARVSCRLASKVLIEVPQEEGDPAFFLIRFPAWGNPEELNAKAAEQFYLKELKRYEFIKSSYVYSVGEDEQKAGYAGMRALPPPRGVYEDNMNYQIPMRVSSKNLLPKDRRPFSLLKAKASYRQAVLYLSGIDDIGLAFVAPVSKPARVVAAAEWYQRKAGSASVDLAEQSEVGDNLVVVAHHNRAFVGGLGGRYGFSFSLVLDGQQAWRARASGEGDSIGIHYWNAFVLRKEKNGSLSLRDVTSEEAAAAEALMSAVNAVLVESYPTTSYDIRPLAAATLAVGAAALGAVGETLADPQTWNASVMQQLEDSAARRAAWCKNKDTGLVYCPR